MSQIHEDYNSLAATYNEIGEGPFIQTNGTKEDILSYGADVKLLLSRKSELFFEEGMAPELVEGFTKALNGYDVAESKHDQAVSGESSIDAEWRAKKEMARVLYTDLTLYGEKAYRNSPELLEKLRKIKEGNTNIDLADDLLNLHDLHTPHLALFEPFKKFDPNWLTQAVELHSELLDLLALKKDPETVIGETALREKQALTHLFKQFGEIRFWGELALRHDQESLAKLKYSWSNR